MILPENILTPIGNLRGALSSGGLIPGLPIIIGEASGAVATFNDGTNNPLIELKIGIEPYQEGTGNPSIINPRPIHGWTELNTHVADGATPHIIDNTYNVTWQDEAQTVYGGVLDWINRKILVNEIAYTISGNEIFTTTGVGQHAIITPSITTLKIENTSDNNYPSYCLCEFAKNMSYTELNVSGITDGIAIGTTFILVGSEQYNNWNSLIGKKFVFKTTDPIEYDLTDVPYIRSILGTNNIWANTGNILQCKYMANIETFLQWMYDNIYTP